MQVLVGVLTVVCGFFMMWGSARGSVDERVVQRDLYQRAVEIDSLQPRGINNGALVLTSGMFVSPEMIEDDFLKPAPLLVLRRRAEMFQWVEEQLPGTQAVTYQKKWVEGQVDFFAFKEVLGHENPLLRSESLTQSVQVATFGSFDGTALLRALRILQPLEISVGMLKDPSLRIVDGKIYIPRSASQDDVAQLGDTRIGYEALPQGEYTVLTVQRDERNLIGAEAQGELVIRRGALSRDEFFASERRETGKVSMGLLQLGALLFFVGLCSVLSPVAPAFSLRPHIPVEGMRAVVVVSAGLAVVAMVIFLISGYLS
jgi:hypothetical protein